MMSRKDLDDVLKICVSRIKSNLVREESEVFRCFTAHLYIDVKLYSEESSQLVEGPYSEKTPKRPDDAQAGMPESEIGRDGASVHPPEIRQG